MSDSFANEFEKWLERKTGERNRVVEEESSEESENDKEFVVSTADIDESKSGIEIYQKHLSILSDQAPILVDDDDSNDLLPNEKEQFEDEPPVLEPAPQEFPDYKMSNLRNPRFSPQHCMRKNCSRNTQMHVRSSSLQEHNKSIKTYSNIDKAKHLSEIHSYFSHKNLLKSKDNKGSGNIFDKFNSDSYENFPPPLIPSPEVLRFHSVLPKLEYKHPSNSPDFCAMEADSTSEIVEDKTDGLYSSRRLSKNSVHGEVAIECDSTCMLAASPVIVSPASVSNGETEEVRDSGGGIRDGNIQGSDYSSVMYDDSVCEKAQMKIKSNVTDVSNLVPDIMNENDCGVLDRIQATESHPCPQLSLINTYSPACKAFPLGVITENESDSISDFPNEPPVLSVISPPLRSHRRSRKKRHMIDSLENFSRSRKKLCTIPSPQSDVENADFDVSIPPTLTHVSETVITLSCKGKHSKAVSQHSSDCQCCLKNKHFNCRKRQQRCNTFPFSNLTEHSSSLPEDLHGFVIYTTQLSQLQTHMHMLVHQLFPQLRPALESISPESTKFENLLSDLITSLEQPDLQKDVQSSASQFPCNDVKQTSVLERQVTDILKLGYSVRSSTGKSLLPPSQGLQAANIVKNIFHSHVVCSPISPSMGNTSHHYSSRQQSHQVQECDLRDNGSDFIIPQLSQMTLKDVEELIRPSRVLLFSDPGARLERFARLSCKTLQLLLPDLTVSLCNELAGSPQDLVIFIDNVILTNSRVRSKH